MKKIVGDGLDDTPSQEGRLHAVGPPISPGGSPRGDPPGPWSSVRAVDEADDHSSSSAADRRRTSTSPTATTATSATAPSRIGVLSLVVLPPSTPPGAGDAVAAPPSVGAASADGSGDAPAAGWRRV